MSKLSERQIALLRALAGEPVGVMTYRVANRLGLATAQVYATFRQLEAKGYAERRGQWLLWRATSSGIQWLRSLDAGRPWMVRGNKR